MILATNHPPEEEEIAKSVKTLQLFTDRRPISKYAP